MHSTTKHGIHCRTIESAVARAAWRMPILHSDVFPERGHHSTLTVCAKRAAVCGTVRNDVYRLRTAWLYGPHRMVARHGRVHCACQSIGQWNWPTPR